jgi:hypothetical protein
MTASSRRRPEAGAGIWVFDMSTAARVVTTERRPAWRRRQSGLNFFRRVSKGEMSEIRTPTVAVKVRRDALGQTCFVLHLVIMIFIVVGWTLPSAAVLVFYLAFVPAVVLQWQFNKGSCLLNNIESLLRTGRWRDPGNAEEGAWLLSLVRSVLGLDLRPVYMEIFVYFVMAVFWGLALAHFLRG